MDDSKAGFPSTAAEKEYVDAANNYKADLRKLLESAPDYVPGTSSNKLSEISALLGKRKKESIEAFDKLTEEVLSEIDESALIQQEKLMGQEGGENRHKK